MVWLRDRHSGELVDAVLVDEISEEHLTHWEAYWQPCLYDRVRELHQAEVPRSEWPSTRQWNWDTKSQVFGKLLAYSGFSIVCEGVTQGMMFVNTAQMHSRLPDTLGQELVYIEYVENAPWNRGDVLDAPRFKGVGSHLVAAAALKSIDEGFNGRVGLHSVPRANGFYNNVCGMTDLGRDSSYDNLRYFELTAEQAAELIKK